MTAYTVSCRDTGADCPGSFTTESKDELVEHVQLHARKAHGKPDLSREDIEPAIKVATPV
jgi:predicted small metal-binding protein